ncbi:MAG: hypothetical protein LQ337_003939 [Flavoplaca oasis]|nr:MAG: hypothetical protein LQ337_003939 [Flavoplaca oasis]
MAAYVYDELDPNRRQIRICTIHSGSFEDPIQCSLHTTSLDDNPEYETLSYAWGAPVFDHTVLVDGAVLKITRSLHDALRYLRPRKQRQSAVDEPPWDRDATGVLWADAICINQADLDERSSQVCLMGDIYRHGARLHVWIGTVGEIREGLRQEHIDEQTDTFDLVTPEQFSDFKTFLLSHEHTRSRPAALSSAALSDDIDADFIGAMEILKIFTEDQHVQHLPFFNSLSADTDLELHKPWYMGLAMLVGILTQPWWKRVWAVQEVLLSTSTSTQATLLHVSHYKILLASCINVRVNFYRHLLGCCFEWYPIVVGSNALLHRLNEASGFLTTLTRLSRCYEDGNFDMTVAYHALGSREATIPHDYVYGLRALMANSPSSSLKVDYQRSVSSLYVEATRAIFRAHNSLEYIHVAIGVDADNRNHLPSWCIDWSQQRKYNDLPYGEGLFSAAPGYFHPFHACEMSDTLLIEALAQGAITSSNSPDQATAGDPVHAVVEGMTYIGQHQVIQDTDIILRVLMRDWHIGTDFRVERLSPRYMEVLREWRDFTRHNNRQLNKAPIKSSLRDIDSRMRRPQRLFMTSRGLLGVGPTTLKQGDCLFVAKGSESPLLLRPIHGSAIEGGQQENFPKYQFVGRCYVHGIMDGEAVTADTEWQTICLS